MARLDVWRCGVVHLTLDLLLYHRQDGLVDCERAITAGQWRR
jgi:hypothetical protein